MTSRRPPSQRDPQYIDQRQSRQIQSFIPGALTGRLASAGPVNKLPGAPDALFGFDGGNTTQASRASKVDIFTLPSDGPQDLTLTFVPIEDSWNVIHQRLGLYETEDFTISGNTLSLLSSASLPAVTGDKVRVQYDYLLEQADEFGDESILPGITLDAEVATSPNLPTGAQAGDFGVCFIALETGQSIAATNGWTQQGSPVSITHAANSGTYTYKLYTLTKTITSSTDVPSVTVSGGLLAPAWGTAVLAGGGSFDSIATDTASATSGTSPAVTTAAGAIRCWFTLSNAGDITAPGRISTTAGDNSGNDIQIVIGAETDLTSVAATCSVTAGWAMSTVAVNG